MIFTQNIFNNATLNIFTDASINKTQFETTGCPGLIATTGPNPEKGIIHTDVKIIRNSTNNHSEIQAISMGVDFAITMKDKFPVINLFSDSKLCIYGLREWIFQWINRTGQNETLVGTYGQEISNQHIIMDIIYKIIDNNLSISLFHQNGHISVNSQKALLEAKNNFVLLNHLTDDVDLDLIRNLSIMNNKIDGLTRYILKTTSTYPKETLDLMKFVYRPFNVQHYAKLIHVI